MESTARSINTVYTKARVMRGASGFAEGKGAELLRGTCLSKIQNDLQSALTARIDGGVDIRSTILYAKGARHQITMSLDSHIGAYKSGWAELRHVETNMSATSLTARFTYQNLKRCYSEAGSLHNDGAPIDTVR